MSPSTRDGVSTSATLAQASGLTGIEQACASCGPLPRVTNSHEAVRELLGTRLDYQGVGDNNNVRAYDRDLVSLPVLGSTAPSVASLLDPIAAQALRSFDTSMLLPPDEWAQMLETSERIVPYMDEILRSDEAK